jgi:hypothetical protein
MNDLRLALLNDGYIERPPSAGVAAIDAAVCAAATCEQCGRIGLDYRPYWRRQPHSYRAFGVCAACGEAREF